MLLQQKTKTPNEIVLEREEDFANTFVDCTEVLAKYISRTDVCLCAKNTYISIDSHNKIKKLDKLAFWTQYEYGFTQISIKNAKYWSKSLRKAISVIPEQFNDFHFVSNLK